MRRLRARVVIVHTLSGVSLRGVMTGEYPDAVVLAHVLDLDNKENLAGELTIPLANISHFQAVDA
jgi:hypothetical protein